MPTFEFTITRNITQSATVRVSACTIEEARATALSSDFHEDPTKAKFLNDDENVPEQPYLPDPEDFRILDRRRRKTPPATP